VSFECESFDPEAVLMPLVKAVLVKPLPLKVRRFLVSLFIFYHILVVFLVQEFSSFWRCIGSCFILFNCAYFRDLFDFVLSSV